MTLPLPSPGALVGVETHDAGLGVIVARVVRVVAPDGALGGLVECRPLSGKYSRSGTFVAGRDLRPVPEAVR